jgi:hypothetical protein
MTERLFAAGVPQAVHRRAGPLGGLSPSVWLALPRLAAHCHSAAGGSRWDVSEEGVP